MSSHHLRNMQQGICGCTPESQCDPNHPICMCCIQNKANGTASRGNGAFFTLTQMGNDYVAQKEFTEFLKKQRTFDRRHVNDEWAVPIVKPKFTHKYK